MKTLMIAIIGFFLLALVYSCGPTTYTVSTRPNYDRYVRPPAPGVGYVWIEGDWYWSGGSYVHRNGYWSRPRGHRSWHEGEWRRRGNGWYWQKGRWHR